MAADPMAIVKWALADQERKQTHADSIAHQRREEEAQAEQRRWQHKVEINQAMMQANQQEENRRNHAYQIHHGMLEVAQKDRQELTANQYREYNAARQSLTAALKEAERQPKGSLTEEQVLKMRGAWQMIQSFAAKQKAAGVVDPEAIRAAAAGDAQLKTLLTSHPEAFNYLPDYLKGDVGDIVARHPEAKDWPENLRTGRATPNDVILSDIDSKVWRNPVTDDQRSQVAGIVPGMFGNPKGIAAADKRIAELEAGDPIQQALGPPQAQAQTAPAAPSLPPGYKEATDRNGGAVPGIFQNGPHSYTNVAPPWSPPAELAAVHPAEAVVKKALDPGAGATLKGGITVGPGQQAMDHALHQATADSHVFGEKSPELKLAWSKLNPAQQGDVLQIHSIRHGVPVEHLANSMNKLMEVPV